MKLRSAVGSLALILIPTHLPLRMEAYPAVFAEVVAAVAAHPFKVLRGTVGRNSTLGTLIGQSVPPSGVHRLVEAALPVHDLARLSVGRPYGLVLGPDGMVRAFTYGLDEIRTLRVQQRADRMHAEVITRRHESVTETVEGQITSSLFGAISDAGEQDQLALDMAEIFAWDVDFNSELQKGDAFKVAVEKTYVDGAFARYGRIVAAELLRGGRLIRAVQFEGTDGRGYYAPDGTPLRKAFLRSPLRFTRISSGFSHARLHPILKTRRPHLGVDFAAPTGTPVRASGGGVVSAAGWAGGYGKVVRIRHANGYETLYGHLSRIAVKQGQRVMQSDIIGAVGSTGLSTGAHLDYRMIRNGVYVNPLRVESPPAEPIGQADLAAFTAVRDRGVGLLQAPATRPLLQNARLEPALAAAVTAAP